jgi:rubrerythrin
MATYYRLPHAPHRVARRRWLLQSTALLLPPIGLGWRGARAAAYPVTAEAMRDAETTEMGVYYRYNAFGRQAQQEGYAGIAYLFVAFAAAEFVHAGNFGRILARLNVEVSPVPKPEFKVGSTKDNLMLAATGEMHSVDEFYPKLLERIRPEGHEDAMTAVRYAWATEQRHRDKIAQIRRWSPAFFEQVAKAIDKKTGQYYVCQICGCTLNALPADACPVCRNPPRHYRHIDPPA